MRNSPQMEAMEKRDGLSRRTFLSGAGGAALAVAASGMLGGCEGNSGDTSPPKDHKDQAAKETAVNAPEPLYYPHLLSPLRIGNHVLKNHIIGTPASPHFLVGPDAWPNEAIMEAYAHTARAGAAIVVLSQPISIHPPEVETAHGWGGHFPYWDLANAGAQNLLSQLTEGVHYYGSLCLWKVMMRMPYGYDVSGGSIKDIEVTTREMETMGLEALNAPPPPAKKEITEEMLQKIVEDVGQQAALGKECGFDGVMVHCAYRGAPTGRLLSKLVNRRTDKYGGSLENRARFSLEIFDAIKNRCGKDFFIMATMSGCEPEGGYTLDDGAEYAKMFTGHIDLLDVKGDPGERDSSPTYFIPKRTPFLYMTEHYKKKGVTLTLSSDGGFHDPDSGEEAISSGKTDAVGMCRGLITNRDFIQLATAGRKEDVVPCIRCNLCNGNGEQTTSAWLSDCAVNPVYGLEHKIDRMVSPPEDKKKVAVIGGGPAGMKAALVAAERGHAVTLYEKTGRLGGNFARIETVSFKWPHKEFKDYLVRQIGKSGVTVRLNTEADAAMIRKEGCDAVIAAIGAEPVVPDIPGVRGKNVVYVPDVYGEESSLAKDVVFIGGGQTGVEAAMHLALKGHNITVLEASKMLAPEALRIHFYSALLNAWEQLPNCHYVQQAHCTGISEEGVTYTDADGRKQSIKAGSVVVAAGMKAKTDPALAFAGTGPWFYTVGDCRKAGDLRMAMRSAFSTASMI